MLMKIVHVDEDDDDNDGDDGKTMPLWCVQII